MSERWTRSGVGVWGVENAGLRLGSPPGATSHDFRMTFVCFSLGPHGPLFPQLPCHEQSYNLCGTKVGEGRWLQESWEQGQK